MRPTAAALDVAVFSGRLLVGPGVAVDERYEPALAQLPNHRAARRLRHIEELLHPALAYGDDQPPARGQLREQGPRHAGRPGRHRYRVVGRALGPAEAVTRCVHLDVPVPQLS